jgi:hypothetical protein
MWRSTPSGTLGFSVRPTASDSYLTGEPSTRNLQALRKNTFEWQVPIVSAGSVSLSARRPLTATPLGTLGFSVRPTYEDTKCMLSDWLYRDRNIVVRARELFISHVRAMKTRFHKRNRWLSSGTQAANNGRDTPLSLFEKFSRYMYNLPSLSNMRKEEITALLGGWSPEANND